ncbi:efflux RND transporter periplasmic adaptor subunit [Desertivirga arenae]|uniref:efflux RND transporter periplasmic adaptor subunit n=1 Tax=Desertivirga arenae TaxID=2810309 RepID=UPI001A967EAC|nr:HlyD family efflux transporter periplasmic adaptor subunit [Pedobacter sp. SYSU D00823]
MDRAITSNQLNRQKLKTYLVTAIIITIIIFAFTQFKNLVKPSIKRAALRVSVAERGAMEATIAASGVVLPEYEVLITSPVSSKIEKVLHSVGETVLAYEPILQLSKESSLIAFEKLNEEQQVNRNKINQLELSLQKSLNELETQCSIKEVRIKSLETAVAHEQSLLSIGGGTEESLKQAQLNLKVARLELRQLINQMANQKAIMKADLKSLGYEINIRDKDIRELQSKIRQTAINSPRKGVITWINDKVGAEVNQGAELVRIADLGSYKVEASISDNYGSEVRPGKDVIVRLGNTNLRGSIINVQPAIENGTIKFSIGLKKKDAKQLRPNLKGDVFVITSFKNNAIRVQNGPAFSGSQEQIVFILQGSTASARRVKMGESNSEYVEILSGIKEGERVITSDMQEFMHLNAIQIK